MDMDNADFEVGQKHENMKGPYEVLSIDRNAMRIRWEDGEEMTTTVVLQKQILKRLNREQEEGEKKKK